ncbi:MAG TPA: response regulator [Termitinemataceae bacterium]|nr:response regulator [Termitinemataceae bacterium]HOM23408.1 response regulator [Termitinemataceae bacterium]HPQ01354.1 response regulator [Termitinemataceae bacterium]
MYSVLIVDDEEIIRQGIAQVIPWEAEGFRLIGVAENGQEALEKVELFHPDIVLTDIKMPVMDGIELIRQVRERGFSVEFIILSGYGEFELAQAALEYGARHYLLKPSSEATIVEALRHVAEQIEKKREDEAFIKESKERLYKFLPLVKEQFIRDLFMGASYTEEEFEYYRTYLHIDFETASLVLYQIEGILSYEDLFVLLRICKKLSPSQDAIGTIINSHVVMLYPLMQEQELISHIALVQKQFSMYFSRKISVVYETQVLLCELASLYQELLLGCRYMGQKNPGLVLHRTQIPFSEIRKSDDLYRSQDLLLALQCGDKAAVSRELESLFAVYRSKKMGLRLVRSHLEQLLLWLEKEGNFEFFRESIDLFLGSVSDTTSLEELENMVRTMFEELVNRNYRSIKNYKNRLVNLLIHYAQAHLSNEHLSLKWLAQKYLHVDPGYLSKLFVKETGQRFKHYLLRMRIEKARRLLDVYSEDRIYEIAREVGMGDNPQYFSQVFKKYTGKSPSEYKKTTIF